MLRKQFVDYYEFLTQTLGSELVLQGYHLLIDPLLAWWCFYLI